MASKRRLRRKKCSSKKPYLSKDSAYMVIRRKGLNALEDLEAYKCRFCHKWHIGHRIGYFQKVKQSLPLLS